MENNNSVDVLTSISRPVLPISLREPPQFPTHEPSLEQLTDYYISRNLPAGETLIISDTEIPYSNSSVTTETVELDVIIPVSTNEDQHNSRSPPSKYWASCVKICLWTATWIAGSCEANANVASQDENRPAGAIPSTPDFIVPIDENVPESAIDPQDEAEHVEASRFPRSHLFRYPNVAWLLTFYLAFLGTVSTILKREKHMTCITTNPFGIISIVAYALAFLSVCASICIYEHLENQNSSHQNQYLHRCYKFLKISFYILCVLAFFSLLPPFFTTSPKN